MQSGEGALDRRDIRREVLRLAWPVVLQQFFQTMMFFTDTLMIGRLGPTSMAAMGVVGPINYSTFSILGALGVGTIATVARAVGEKNLAKQRADAMTSLSMAVSFGILLSVVGAWLLPMAADLFQVADDPGVTQQAKGYLFYLGAGFGPILIGISTVGILRAAGDSKTPMVFGILSNLLNIGANYVLIFGKFGFPAMGVAGSALATAISLTFAAAGGSVWLFLPWSRLRLWMSSVHEISRESYRRLVKVTIPATIEPLILHSGFLLYMKAVTTLGSESLAAHRAAITIESLSFMPGYGMSVACAALVGQSLGARDPERAEVGFQESARVTVFIMSLIGLVFLLLGVPLMSLMVPGNPGVILLGATCLAICALEQPFLGLAMVYGGALRGAGDSKSPMWVGLIGVWGVRVPLAFFLAHFLGWGLYGIWMTMIADWVVRAGVFRWIHAQGAWKKIDL